MKNIFGNMKILWIIFFFFFFWGGGGGEGGHHKIGLYLGVISLHIRVFSLRQGFFVGC